MSWEDNSTSYEETKHLDKGLIELHSVKRFESRCVITGTEGKGMESLLAHLYTRIKGSKEDLATESLQYLLSVSSELNRSFTRLLKEALKISIPDTLEYSCQLTGKDRERPDMSGKDSLGKELVLCEMKFYAGLTHNQPLTYIDRLKENGKGLVFICPRARQTSLYTQLLSLCAGRETEIVDEQLFRVDGISMTVLTWTQIIEDLRKTAAATKVECLSDITQLQGFCDRMDSEAFIPFSDEDISVESAKKACRFYQIVDEVYELLQKDSRLLLKTGRTKQSSYKDSYCRYLSLTSMDKIFVRIIYDQQNWRNSLSAVTPFWLCIGEDNGKFSPKVLKFLDTIPAYEKDNHWWNMTAIALYPKLDAPFDEVCADIKDQIVTYIMRFNSQDE